MNETTPSGKPRRIPIRRAVLPLLLATSLVANVLLVRQWIRGELASHATRLDPVGLDTYEADRAKPAPTGPVLEFFGDSRAAMWPTPAGLTGYTVVNRGVGYQTTAQIALRIDADVAPLHPAVVVLEAGVNDLKTIADLPAKRARIIADCEANLRRIVERCHSLASTVILVSVFDIGDVPLWRKPFWSDDVVTAVGEVNAFLPTLTRDGVVLLDAAKVLDDDHGKVKAAYQLDYLHLLPTGYDALDAPLVSLVGRLPR